MRLSNQNVDFVCFRDCIKLFLLLTTITLLCFPSYSIGADASFHTIPALGRNAQLGFLYDERTDTFRPISIFSKEIPNSVIVEAPSPDVTTQTFATNTFEQKLHLLDISLNAGSYILAGNTKVKGTATILKDRTENVLLQEKTLLRTHYTVEENLQVYYNDLRPFFNAHLLQHRDATHIVSGISWGSRISITLQTTLTPQGDAEELSDAFYDEFQKIKGKSSTSNQINENFNFSIDIKSDIPLTAPVPTTTSEVAILLNKTPQIINETNGGKGVPLEFTLTPLSELRTHLNVQTIINNSVYKIKNPTLRSVMNIFDDIFKSEQRITALYEKTRNQLHCLPPQSREEISDLRTNLLNYKTKVADNLKEMLVDVRSGSKPISELTEIVEDFSRSNFSSRSIKNKIREYDDVINKISFCEMLQASYSNIEYFNSHQDLIPRISKNSERPIYILFTKTEFKNKNPVKYTEDLNTFLTTLNVPSNELFIVDCDGGHVSCSSLNQTEIHEYKNGKLTSTNFKQDAENEESDLRKEFNDLKNDIRILQNLTAHVTSQLQNHINNQHIDHCESNPCTNSGLCHSRVNSFTCICPPGFTGPTCTENVNECQSTQNPCENSGHCIDEIGGFTCVCPPSFAGQKCQEKLDPCRNINCENDGSCIALSNYLDFSCSCADGFNGTYCEINIDDCLLSELCQNGGTCVDVINSYTCACAEGYEGRDCATVTNNCENSQPCLNGGTCVQGINSYTCACADEFAGSVCQNLNKCQYPGACASPSDVGICDRCRDGFVKDPENDTRCKYANSNASLLMSSYDGIRLIPLDGLNGTPRVKNTVHVRGMDYNFRTNTLFRFSLVDKTIYTAPLNGGAENKSIFQDSSSYIHGIAVDWIYQHLYWVDEGRDQLCVSNFNGTMKKILFKNELQRPLSIAVNPLNGWMYWTDESKNHIERAGLDGSRREVLISTNIKSPHGLALDFVDSRLYWSHGINPTSLWSSNFDGSDRKLVYTSSSSQFSLQYFWKIFIFDKYAFLLDFASKTIYKVNKCNGQEIAMIYKSASNLNEIKIYDATVQPEGENVCFKRIGNCSHFCFPVPSPSNNGSVTTTTCGCPDGLSLSADRQNCV